jgi:hypothetical protein
MRPRRQHEPNKRNQTIEPVSSGAGWKETAKASGQQRENSSNPKKSEAPITTNGTSEDSSIQATEPDGSPTEKKYQVFLHHLINVSAKFRSELTGP